MIKNTKVNLVIDTTSEYLVIALAHKDSGKLLAGKTVRAGQKHSEILIDTVDRLLNKHNLDIKDIDKVGGVVGPGSFTGIRIGLAFARTLAHTKKIPVVPITTFEALATTTHQQGLLEGKMLIMVDALLPLVHWAIADIATHRLLRNYPPRLDTIEDVLKKIPLEDKSQIHFAGGSAFKDEDFIKKIKKEFPLSGKRSENIIRHPSPEALSKLSSELPFYNDISRLSPLYLKDVYLRK